MQPLNPTPFQHAIAQLLPPTTRHEQPIPAAADGLHICPTCHSHLVQPTQTEETNDHTWQITLHCPNCGHSRTGHYENTHVYALERELDRGDAELQTDLARLTHTNMTDEIDRFTHALNANAIQPFDF